MPCKFCEQFWDSFWKRCYAWEREHSNEDELLAQESEQSLKIIQRASALHDEDPAGAFRLYIEAVDAGSVWSMEAVGWRYWTGTGVAVDSCQAGNYYRLAVAEGSQMARIDYARLLAENKQHDECERLLEQGLASEFIPAYFWLARLRFDRFKSSKVAREVRPMLQHAASEGHPGAQHMLSKLMLTGKFGLSEIPYGLVSAVRWTLKFAATRY